MFKENVGLIKPFDDFYHGDMGGFIERKGGREFSNRALYMMLYATLFNRFVGESDRKKLALSEYVVGRGAYNQISSYTVSNSDKDSDASLVFIYTDDNDIEKLLEMLSEVSEETSFTNEDNWERNTIVEAYVKNRALVFNSKLKNEAVVCVPRRELDVQHRLASAIMRIAPWLYEDFDREKEELSMRIFKSLTMSTYEEFLKCVDEANVRYGIANEVTRQEISGIARIAREARINSLNSDIRDFEGRIETAYRLIGEHISTIQRMEKELFSETNMINDEAFEELANYILSNESIRFVKRVRGRVVFDIKHRMTDVDADAAETLIRERTSYLYDGCNNFGNISKEDMRILWTGLFIDQEIQLSLFSRIMLDFDTKTITAERGTLASTPSVFEVDSIRNPHIEGYNCFGGNKQIIIESLRKNDFIMAIQQAVASVGGINVYDSTVMSTFSNTIVQNANDPLFKGFVLPNGITVGAKLAIAYLKGELEDLENVKND